MKATKKSLTMLIIREKVKAQKAEVKKWGTFSPPKKPGWPEGLVKNLFSDILHHLLFLQMMAKSMKLRPKY